MAKREEIEKFFPYPVNKLYRYRSFDSRELDLIFTHQDICLRDPTTFNDPFDCRPKLVTHRGLKKERFLEDLIKNLFPDTDKKTIKKLKRKPLQSGLLEKGFNWLIKGFGVYCLSEKKDDLLMWSHYSSSHTGICIEFDASKKGTLFWEAMKVCYEEDYPIVNLMDLNKPEEYRKAFLTKSTHWKYEEERRILKNEEKGGPGIYKFPPELLTGVILGVRISEENKNKVIEWVSKYPTTITVFQSKLNNRKYQLDIESI